MWAIKRNHVTTIHQGTFISKSTLGTRLRDYLRFLWYDLDLEEPIVYKFLRVVFGLTSSPFLLNATIKHHLNRYVQNEHVVIERLKNDLYVDDLVSGSDLVSG